MCVPDSVCTSENLVSCKLSFSVAAPEAWGLFSFLIGNIFWAKFRCCHIYWPDMLFLTVSCRPIGIIGFDLQCSNFLLVFLLPNRCDLCLVGVVHSFVHLVVVNDVVMSSMPIASGLDFYSPLTVLDYFCHTCFWSDFDFEDVKLGLVVGKNRWILIATVVIVVDFCHKVVSMLFGLFVVVVGG
jgi:hypothetical protein